VVIPVSIGLGKIRRGASGSGEEAAIRLAIARSRALGDDEWVKQTTAQLGLGHTLRPNGRPRSAREV
jgi:hypothetical protein